MTNINWEIFTPLEQTKLKKAIEEGHFDFLASLVDEMSQEKELELQKVVNSNNNVGTGFQSKAKDNFWKNHANGPETPEEEAQLQKEIDDEYAEYKAEQDKIKQQNENNLTK